MLSFQLPQTNRHDSGQVCASLEVFSAPGTAWSAMLRWIPAQSTDDVDAVLKPIQTYFRLSFARGDPYSLELQDRRPHARLGACALPMYALPAPETYHRCQRQSIRPCNVPKGVCKAPRTHLTLDCQTINCNLNGSPVSMTMRLILVSKQAIEHTRHHEGGKEIQCCQALYIPLQPS